MGFENCQSCGFLLCSANPCLSGFLETKLTLLKSTYPELLLLEVGCLGTANSFYTNEDFEKNGSFDSHKQSFVEPQSSSCSSSDMYSKLKLVFDVLKVLLCNI